MHKAIFLNQDPIIMAQVWDARRREQAAALLPVRPGLLRREDLPAMAGELREVEIIFSTWNMPRLEDSDLLHLPKLRAVLYAAGTVKPFAEPLLERGIQVSSAWRANALPVAEATVAHVLLGLKQVLQSARAIAATRSWAARPPVTGAYGSTVGLIALGAIGRRVVELLKPYNLRIIAHDPYAQPCEGVTLVGLEELFATADVVSLHAPWIPATERMIRGAHVLAMRPYATFINTSRGALVDEVELAEALRKRTDVQAILDVTWPEPPASDSPLWCLPNVLLTPHIAGSGGNEVLRLADYMLEECRELLAGRPLRHAVTPAMLATMA
jgi:phosphoglycerate dehydrogenase-like enzyme